MSLDQLYELYDEIDVEQTFVAADSDQFWEQATNEQKYKAYICSYVHFNKMQHNASFASFVFKINGKLKRISDDVDYNQHVQNLSIHNMIHLNNVVNNVLTGEKTWMEGLQELYTLRDLYLYGW